MKRYRKPKPPFNTIRIKTPGIRFNKGKALSIPWWKMELILNIVTMNAMNGALYYIASRRAEGK